MADLQKTVAIIFESESSNATAKVDALAKSIENIDGGNGAQQVEKVGTAIDKVGESSTITEQSARKLGDGLKKLAEDAGVPKEALGSIDNLLLRIGGPAAGSAVLAATAVAAYAVVMLNAGSEAVNFKTRIDNLTGGTKDSEAAFNFVAGAVAELETSLADSLDLYAQYLAQLDGTKISGRIAEDAFVGISAAIKGQGGDFKDTGDALKKFVEAAADGQIDLKELESKIADIPGGLRIFAEALGVPVEDLKLLAENGKLGREEIELFASALRGQDYGSLTPVKDAFLDLWNTIKAIARDIGAEGFVEGAFSVLETAIRGLTLTVVGAVEFVELLGGTLANIAFSVANLDFAGFDERQSELFKNFGDGIETAKNKFLGLREATSGEQAREAATDYQALADSLEKTADNAAPAAEQTEKLGTAADGAAKAAANMQRALAETEKAIAKQAEETRKATESAQKFELEMEKIASNERIKLIEASVKLDIAQLEADTQRLETIFQSIDSTVTSTGDLLGDLFGSLGDIGSSFDPRFKVIEDQIELENKRRQEALDLQKKLVEAQIAQIRAQTQKLEKGDPIIKIDGAGLQPHLEAFMFEILRTLQVRVNQDGLGMLLGLS